MPAPVVAERQARLDGHPCQAKPVTAIEAAHTPGNKHIVADGDANPVVLGCYTVINLAAAINTEPPF